MCSTLSTFFKYTRLFLLVTWAKHQLPVKIWDSDRWIIRPVQKDTRAENDRSSQVWHLPPRSGSTAHHKTCDRSWLGIYEQQASSARSPNMSIRYMCQNYKGGESTKRVSQNLQFWMPYFGAPHDQDYITQHYPQFCAVLFAVHTTSSNKPATIERRHC